MLYEVIIVYLTQAATINQTPGFRYSAHKLTAQVVYSWRKCVHGLVRINTKQCKMFGHSGGRTNDIRVNSTTL